MSMVALRSGRSYLTTLPMESPVRDWMVWETARAISRPYRSPSPTNLGVPEPGH